MVREAIVKLHGHFLPEKRGLLGLRDFAVIRRAMGILTGAGGPEPLPPREALEELEEETKEGGPVPRPPPAERARASDSSDMYCACERGHSGPKVRRHLTTVSMKKTRGTIQRLAAPPHPQKGVAVAPPLKAAPA